ncbi:phage terminase large subunit [Lysobacter sp. CA199]|uniref:phage terminase large subunit n=1 Tax=Lysobacter sp. CA199 TaxID=3455608 RepID=UPI003F8D06E7
MSSAPVLRPQPGPQEAFLASSADIAIYGGAAYGGKTFALLLEGARHSDNPKFGAVIFRRTTKQITNEGALWDTASGVYPQMDAKPNLSTLTWTWPSGAALSFAHLEHEKNKLDWQGSQIALLGFDELTHFTAGQFWYLISRNRSTSGVRPYVRATCNPDPDSFVAELIAWWIDPETGYAIPERSGVLRWFVRVGNLLHWADTAEELAERFPDIPAKSLTFIASSFTDNKIGLQADPGYVANLMSLPTVERERLLRGNWKVKAAAGDYFKRSYFTTVDHAPAEARRIRYWDRAATLPSESNPDPDWTAGVRLSDPGDGYFYIEHVERFRGTPGQVAKRIRATAESDGRGVAVGIEQDPAAAGKFEAATYLTLLQEFSVFAVPPQGDKETRASPASAQAEHGRFRIVKGAWNAAFLDELESFPKGGHDDQVDAFSGAYNQMVGNPRIPLEFASAGSRGGLGHQALAAELTDTGFGTVAGGNDFEGYV